MSLKSKTVYHCPMNSVCMWNSRSWLSEQNSIHWKVCRVPTSDEAPALQTVPVCNSEFTMTGSPARTQLATLLSPFITHLRGLVVSKRCLRAFLEGCDTSYKHWEDHLSYWLLFKTLYNVMASFPPEIKDRKSNTVSLDRSDQHSKPFFATWAEKPGIDLLDPVSGWEEMLCWPIKTRQSWHSHILYLSCGR